MADKAAIPDSASAAPAAAAAPQALPDSPPAAPAVADTAAPAAPVVAEAAPAPEAAAPEAAKPAPTLLQKFDAEQKAETDKPVEAKPDAEKPKEGAADVKPEAKPGEKPVEAKPEAKPDGDKKPEEPKAEPAKLEPVAYEYALPETLKMDDARKGELHAALDAFRADPSKGVQGLIDLHNKAGEELKAQVDQHQRDVWADTQKDWENRVLSDEEIGGNGHRTAMKNIAEMRDMFVPEKDRKDFEQFLEVTGAGNHPAFLRMLNNAHRLFGEPPMPPSEIKPSPNNGANPNARKGILYDHPRSANNRQQ